MLDRSAARGFPSGISFFHLPPGELPRLARTMRPQVSLSTLPLRKFSLQVWVGERLVRQKMASSYLMKSHHRISWSFMSSTWVITNLPTASLQVQPRHASDAHRVTDQSCVRNAHKGQASETVRNSKKEEKNEWSKLWKGLYKRERKTLYSFRFMKSENWDLWSLSTQRIRGLQHLCVLSPLQSLPETLLPQTFLKTLLKNWTRNILRKQDLAIGKSQCFHAPCIKSCHLTILFYIQTKTKWTTSVSTSLTLTQNTCVVLYMMEPTRQILLPCQWYAPLWQPIMQPVIVLAVVSGQRDARQFFSLAGQNKTMPGIIHPGWPMFASVEVLLATEPSALIWSMKEV